MKNKVILFILLIINQITVTSQNQNIMKFHIPFHIEIDPMERLLLMNIEKDPDSIYIGFEPQYYQDAKTGTGHLIIAWREDGKVDVYHQKGLNISPENYDIVGKGLSELIVTEMPIAIFDIGTNGVEAHYVFKDKYHRMIELKILEKNQKERKPFGLLAPMGSAAENPKSLPLILLNDFYFVREKDTEINISINQQKHKADKLPIRMDGSKMLFSRYSPEPLIARLNPETNQTLDFVEINQNQDSISKQNVSYYFVWENKKPCLTRMVFANDKHPITLKFSKAFPEIQHMEVNTNFATDFTISSFASMGLVGGKVKMKKNQEVISMQLIPSGGWIQKADKFSLKFLYTFARVFKNWPKTYLWSAEIKSLQNDNIHIQSHWKRTNK